MSKNTTYDNTDTGLLASYCEMLGDGLEEDGENRAIADMAARRLRSLDAIVRKLPKTADGETVIPGQTVYNKDGLPLQVSRWFGVAWIVQDDKMRCGYIAEVESTYSTADAAEAAADETDDE